MCRHKKRGRKGEKLILLGGRDRAATEKVGADEIAMREKGEDRSRKDLLEGGCQTKGGQDLLLLRSQILYTIVQRKHYSL